MFAPLKEKKCETKLLPNKERSRELIAVDIRCVMTALVKGKLRWPWYLWGAPGVGKTCAALCLIDFATGRYWTADQWAADLNESREGGMNERTPDRIEVLGADDGWRYGEFRPELVKPGRSVVHGGKIIVVKPADLWHRVKSAPLFVLDDVGMRDAASEHQRLSVKRILDDRYGLPTIVISNREPSEMERIYGAATARRMVEGTINLYSRKT